MNDRPYVRVYTEVIDDPKFVGIFDDDHHLALWLRLLIAADAAWPASAYVPRSARKASLAALSDAGIVDLLPGDRYRIHGLDAERSRRSESARVGGIASGRSRSVERTLNERSAFAEPNVNLTEPSRAEPRRDAPARAREGDIPEGPVLEWMAQHGAYLPPTGGGLHRRLIALTERHGPETVIAAFESLLASASSSGQGVGKLSDRQYVLGAENALDAIPAPDRKAAAENDREAQARDDHARRVAATKRLISEYTGEPAA